MIQIYLFDLDDTLIDTKIYAQLYQPILQIIHREKRLSGKGLDAAAKELGLKKNKYGRYDSGDLCKALGLLEDYYQELEKQIKVSPVLHDSVIDVFQTLQKRKKKIGIVSNSMQRTAQLYLKKYDLSKYVDFIFSQDDAGCRKDNDAYWTKLIKKENLKVRECLVIGDNLEEDVFIPTKLGFNTFHLEEPSKLREILKS